MTQSSYLSILDELEKERELRRLKELQNKYITNPNYSNMNLRNELQTRFDLDEMKRLEEKYKNSFSNNSVPNTQTTNNNANTESSLWNNVKNIGNKIADITTTATVGYTNGATLGNFDELAGGATALLSGNANNYQTGRDAVRNMNKQLQQNNPTLYHTAETIGAATSPIKLFNSSKSAPLSRHNQNRIYNAITNTGIATAGYSNNLDEVPESMATIGAGNALGYIAGNKALGRGIGNSARILYDYAGSEIPDWLQELLKKLGLR